MASIRIPPVPEPNDTSGRREHVDLAALAKAKGLPVEVLRTFAKISDPSNRHLFTAEAAQKAFSGVKV